MGTACRRDGDACARRGKKEERRIVIKVDGKDMSIPEAASHAIDKAMASWIGTGIERAGHGQRRRNPRVDPQGHPGVEANAHGVVINRRSASDAVEKNNLTSAREVREFKQTLADGTLIQRQSTACWHATVKAVCPGAQAGGWQCHHQ